MEGITSESAVPAPASDSSETNESDTEDMPPLVDVGTGRTTDYAAVEYFSGSSTIHDQVSANFLNWVHDQEPVFWAARQWMFMNSPVHVYSSPPCNHFSFLRRAEPEVTTSESESETDS